MSPGPENISSNCAAMSDILNRIGDVGLSLGVFTDTAYTVIVIVPLITSIRDIWQSRSAMPAPRWP